MSSTPPSDPEEWNDEQWLAWLEETDVAEQPSEASAIPGRRGRSVGSQMLYAGMFGLHQAIYGANDEPITIVVDADGDPAEPESLEVHLDEDHPDESTVVVRPWLLDGHHPDDHPRG